MPGLWDDAVHDEYLILLNFNIINSQVIDLKKMVCILQKLLKLSITKYKASRIIDVL